VAAEQPSLFYELLAAEPLLVKGLAAKCFRSAVLSSEVASDSNPPGPRLTFTFALPPSSNEGVETLNTLLVGCSTQVVARRSSHIHLAAEPSVVVPCLASSCLKAGS
jgi:hypothetical protein